MLIQLASFSQLVFLIVGVITSSLGNLEPTSNHHHQRHLIPRINHLPGVGRRIICIPDPWYIVNWLFKALTVLGGQFCSSSRKRVIDVSLFSFSVVAVFQIHSIQFDSTKSVLLIGEYCTHDSNQLIE